MCKAANALIALGVKKGDRVAIYMPMIPETVFAMLACARLGAPHMVVFAGYSSEALSTRIIDCDAQIVITADGAWRKGAQNALKPAVDEALKTCPGVRNVLVVKRTGQEVGWTEGRDVWWHDVVDSASPEHTPESLRLRASAVHHVHVRDDRQAEGRAAHHRRISHPRVRDLEVHLRHEAGDGRVLDRGGYRLGHRAQLHRVWAAWPTG